MKFTAIQKRAMKANPLGFAKSMPRKELGQIIDELEARYSDPEQESPLSDEQYDLMHDYYWKGKKKPAKKVGGVKNVDITLEVPMNSLDKFRTVSSAKQAIFMRASSYVISDKEDGISLAITYDGGVPVLATTRGETGLVGKDVSKVIPYLNIPKSIAYKKRFMVRAEFTIDTKVFKAHFPDDKTGRNTAGGLLNRDVPAPCIALFRVVCYEILLGKNAGHKLEDQLKLLKKYGFDVVPYIVVDAIDEEFMTEKHNERKKKAKRDIDGIVVAKNQPYKIEPGYPDYAYAFKINSLETAVRVVVKEVIWEETRYGKWFPRIMIEPTVIGGVLVTFFTGHNNYYIEHGHLKPKKKGEPVPYEPRPINKGAVILAVRSGDVIPYIMQVVKGAKTASKPEGAYKKKGVHLVVVETQKTNTRVVKELAHFFSELEVDGLKRGGVQVLVDAGYDTVKKILKMSRIEAQSLPGFADKSGAQLHKALKACKPRMTFLNVARGSAAFGEGIGPSRLTALMETVPDFMDHADKSVEELTKMVKTVKGLDKLAEQIAENLKTFNKFCKRNGITLAAAEKQEIVGNQMDGQRILFTSIRDAEVQAWIIANGGKIATTVNQATSLIVKDESASNDKTKAAVSKGIPIITIAQFRKTNRI
ncbi:MAG: BRCT domain-containing protein [Patescibacteria group bacterium]